MVDRAGQRAPRTPWPSMLPRRRPVVLTYHGFTEKARANDPENMFVTRADFEMQLDHLLEHGWEPLDLDGFLATMGGGRKGKSFLLTIDDALECVGDWAAPALRARPVPAVHFVPAGLVGGTADWLPQPRDEPLLDSARLRAIAHESLVKVGAHGREHMDMRGLDSRQLDRQTTQACEKLREITGSPIRAFANPFGAHDSQARGAVARAECSIGFSVFEDDGRFAVSRVDVNATDTISSFRLNLVPAYRAWWRALGRASFVRRLVRSWLTRRPGGSGGQDREAG